MTRNVDVVVAGGGLVGAAFAALMAKKVPTLSVAVIESHPFSGYFEDTEFDPRVVALTEASRRMLAEIGVWQTIAQRRVTPYTHMSVWDSDGTGFIEFDGDDIGEESIGHIVENANIVGALQDKLADYSNIELICPAKVESVTRNGEQLTVTLDSGETLSALLLVAADGARSSVRTLCDFALNEDPYGHSAIVATIECEHPHGATARQWFSSDGPLAFLPINQSPDGNGESEHHISIVWSQRNIKAKELMALDDAEFCTALSRASQFTLGNVKTVSKRFCFPLTQRHASDYVKPNVALLGDAAHTIHPLAGQGVNLGFKDVVALVDELKRATERGLPLGDLCVLNRYQRVRKPDNLATMAAMKGFKELFGSELPILRVLRNEGMSLVNKIDPLKKQLIRQAMGL
ncbi:UbiH/UbiF/VisC/COQ6 family ubiquinone biosynthesis hydroxylase [Porticoccaceae bacterium LTM1]|nr:UbiH/UbiF/VisC/COQ6 family ubiquinone biosynthesis hydroxylase [Porticoccaceae bacterium LTM1]